MPSDAPAPPVPLPALAELLTTRLSTDLDGLSPGTDVEGFELCAADLLVPVGLREAIAHMPPKSRSAHDEAISGTLLAKSYTLVALAALTAFSLSDIRLEVGLEDVRLRVRPDEGMRVLLRLRGPLATETGHRSDDAKAAGRSGVEEARRDGLVELLRELVAGNMASVFAQIRDETGAQLRTMEALLSANVRNTYLRIEQQTAELGIAAERAAVVERDRDFMFSADALPGTNPLAQPTRLYTPATPGASPTYVRNRCCLRYRISVNGERVPYCLTCPLLSDQERERMIAEHHHHEDNHE